LEVFERRPPTAELAAPSVISRHPKTFTTAGISQFHRHVCFVPLTDIQSSDELRKQPAGTGNFTRQTGNHRWM